jgi:hypothetical protein
MACQLACPVIRHVSLSPCTETASAVPRFGQCLNLGRARRTKSVEIVALHGDGVGTVWQIACKLQKVHVRTQKPPVKRCAALDLSSPQAARDQVARTSPGGLLFGQEKWRFNHHVTSQRR